MPTEASAIPLRCLRGGWGEQKIRGGERSVRLTPLTALTFFVSTKVVFETLSLPARAVTRSGSLAEANQALHALGIKTELDLESERYQQAAFAR